VPTVAERAAAYGIASARVDGNDAVAMWHAIGAATDRAREGGGPTLIDAVTYRFHGHILGEDLAYQPAEERAAAVAADPFPAYRARLISEYGISETVLDDIDRRVAAEVDDAFRYALASPEPGVSSLFTDVVAEVTV
jgi:TPP-dependent pyruvate/acetoin dehydrogenase alpha subunit